MKKIRLCFLFFFSAIQFSFGQSDFLYTYDGFEGIVAGETPAVSFLTGKGTVKWGFYGEDSAKITFVIEAKSAYPKLVGVNYKSLPAVIPNTIQIVVNPKKFKIVAGKNYSINTSYFDPWIQKATKNGELLIELHEPSNCTIVIEDATEGNLLNNPSFEIKQSDANPDGWKLGVSGEDRIKIDSVIKHTGYKSLVLAHNGGNGKAYIQIASPVNVKTNQSYLAAFYYHLQNAVYGSVFYFSATIAAPGKKDIIVEPLYTSTAIIYPMPISNSIDGWQRAFINVNVPKDYLNATILLKIEAAGVPYQLFIDDIELRKNPSPAAQFTHYLPEPITKTIYSKEEVYAIMNKKNAVKVELPVVGKSPLKINDEVIPLLAFASIHSADWPNQSSHKEYLRHGLKIHFVPIIGYSNNPVTCTWLGKNKYNFAPLENMLSKMYGYDPDAVVMLYVDVHLQIQDKGW